jgi:hypothetical protein
VREAAGGKSGVWVSIECQDKDEIHIDMFERSKRWPLMNSDRGSGVPFNQEQYNFRTNVLNDNSMIGQCAL